MIRVVPDVGAPLTVTAIDLVGESLAPTWSEWLTYGMTGLGFLAGWTGWGGDYMKNIGVSSLPLSAKRIYDRVRGGAPVGRRLALRKVSRYPAPAAERQFQGARLV